MKKQLLIMAVSCLTPQVYGKTIGPDSVRQTKELKELVVKSNRSLFVHKGNKDVFLVDNLKDKEGMQGIDLMSYAPGLSVNAEEKVLLKGKEPVFYLNDRKLESNEVNTLLKALQAKDIARIEVSHSRDAADDGDSNNGTVYIYTKRETGFSWTTQLQGQLIRWKDYGYFPGTSVNYGGKYWNVYGSYNYYQFTGQNNTLTGTHITTPEGEPLFFHQDDFESNYLVKEMNYRFGSILTFGKYKQHSLGAEFSGSRDAKFHFANTNWLWKKDYTKGLEDHGNNDMINEKPSFNYTATLSWKWELDSLGSNLQVIGNYFKLRSHVNITQNAVYEHIDEWNTDETDKTLSNTRNYSIQADILKHIRNWEVQGGLKYIHTGRDNNSSYILPANTTNYAIKYHEQIVAGYASVSRHTKYVDLTAGLRIEGTKTTYRENDGQQTTGNDWHVLPNFNFLHHLNEDWSYGLIYDMAINRPSFSNLSKGTVRYNDYSYSIGNPDLKAYVRHKGELDINYRQHTLSVEYTQAKDMIIHMVVKADEKVMYEQDKNAGKYKNWKISYNYAGNIFPWWNLNLYAHAEHDNYPLNYRYTRLWTGFININSHFMTGKYGNISLSLNSAIGDLGANTKMTRNYTTVGVSYSFSVLKKSLNIQLAANDIFHGFRNDYTDYYPTYTIVNRAVFPTQILSLRLTYTFTSKHKIQDKNVDQGNSIQLRM